jgi:hypothetical protein
LIGLDPFKVGDELACDGSGDRVDWRINIETFWLTFWPL